MHGLDQNEDRPRGTYQFPFEFHHIDSSHPRYEMSYHWHVEYEIMRILRGSLTVTLDEKALLRKQVRLFLSTAAFFTVAYQTMTVYMSVLFLTLIHLSSKTPCVGNTSRRLPIRN